MSKNPNSSPANENNSPVDPEAKNGREAGNGEDGYAKNVVKTAHDFFKREGIIVSLQETATEEQYALALRDHLEPVRCHDDVWRVYGDGCWAEVKAKALLHLALGILAPIKRTEHRAEQVIKHLAALLNGEPEAKYATFLIQEPERTLINCANGVLAVTPQKVELLGHSADYNFTKCVLSDWDPTAECPLFIKTIMATLPDFDDAQLFQVFTGYIFMDDCRFQCCLLMVGPGDTGKSTLLIAIGNVLGSELISGTSLSNLCNYQTFALPRIKDRALNMATELDVKEIQEGGVFKALVCGELVPRRSPYQGWDEMTTHCKHIFGMNAPPYFAHCTDAELRRIRLLACNQKVRNRDVKLSDKLALERSGILRFMVQGLQQLMSLTVMPQGGAESLRLTARYNDQATPVVTFCRDCCEFDPQGCLPMRDLFDEYNKWASDNEGQIRTKQSFHREFQRVRPDVRKGRRRGVYVYEGVQFQSETDSKDEGQ